MTKLEFMKELESLLLEIPLEERNEALQYYNGYFDDAGEDQEEEIIKELGSPERVASIIKADLTSTDTNRESRGYFTEKGYQETISNEYEIVGSTKKQESNRNESYENKTNSNANNNTNTKKSNTGLIVLIAVLTSPFWLPFFLSAISIVIGVIAAILGITFGFGIGGVTMICAGIVLFIAGLIQLSAPYTGLVLIGGGLIVFGVGMLLVIACISICKYVLPAMMKGLVNLCRLPFKNRSVMA